MSSLYKFNTALTPIAMYEFDDGVWKRETLSLNETLTLNGDGTITLFQAHDTYNEIKTFTVTPDATDDADVYFRSGKSYTLPDGTPIDSEPEDDDGLEDDGIEDDADGDGSSDDLIDGTDDDDLEHGGSGDDVIDGGAGDDDLFGDEGDDDLAGGDGDDLLIGGVGFDVLTGGTGADSLDGGADDDVLEGGDGADSLLGGAGDDQLYAGSGDDVVDGGVGDDTIIGGDGAGNDAYIGGAGSDTVIYTSAVAGITVNLTSGTAKSTSLDSGIGSDKLAAIENVVAGSYADVLTGSALANKLSGGGGNDVLIGGLGADRLEGGAGDDVFRLTKLTESGLGALKRDVILDFAAGDKIDLSAIDAKMGFLKNDAFVFLSAPPALSSANGALWFRDGVLYGSTDKDIAAEFEIELVGVTSMSASDFVL